MQIQIFYGKIEAKHLWIGKSFITLIQQQKVSFDIHSTFDIHTLNSLFLRVQEAEPECYAVLTFKMIKISEIWHIWGSYPKSALSTLDNSAWIRIRGGQKKL